MANDKEKANSIPSYPLGLTPFHPGWGVWWWWWGEQEGISWSEQMDGWRNPGLSRACTKSRFEDWGKDRGSDHPEQGLRLRVGLRAPGTPWGA